MRAARVHRTLYVVSAPAVHVTIDASVDGEKIHGRIGDGSGRSTAFTAWLGLIGALDGLLSEAGSRASFTEPDEWPGGD